MFKRPGEVFIQTNRRRIYLVGLFLSPIPPNFDSVELERFNVTGEKTHLAATQLSWKLLPKDDHVTEAHPIICNVITTEGSYNCDTTLMKGAL